MWNWPGVLTVTLMASTLASTSGSGLKMPGRFTGTSRWSCGATTMKMMSRTRTTSTSGVTFMSGWTPVRTRSRHATTLWFLPLALDLVQLLLGPSLHAVEHLARRAVQRRLVPRDPGGQVVEAEHRGDGDGEAERGLDKCLGDAGGHRGQAAGSGRGDALERGDDAEHRAEQPDERRHRPDRCEHGQSAPQVGAAGRSRCLPCTVPGAGPSAPRVRAATHRRCRAHGDRWRARS